MARATAPSSRHRMLDGGVPRGGGDPFCLLSCPNLLGRDGVVGRLGQPWVGGGAADRARVAVSQAGRELGGHPGNAGLDQRLPGIDPGLVPVHRIG